ncbi:hydantoinase B/oxoprolinase family protein [Variovorax defluvii]|uniref:Hydantoinase B/oxoprolinase family protein n=1 Tax=Variovorax defluvii TaxID=913761 RepID=A0ABP8I0V1_9BURK
MSTNKHVELVRESLVAVVNEMRANIIHSSYSSIIYEGHDFSCALLSADGKLVAQGLDDNPLHIFAVPYSTARVLEAFAGDIQEGDIFLHNDPYTGGTHLNDVLMLYPVFHEGRLVMFAAARCHWGDVGGMTPGSLSGRVRDIYQEGMRIVPTRICERGRMNEAFLELLFANMRIRQEREGDFRTMLGTSRKAAEHVQRLYRRFGAAAIEGSIGELMKRAERVMRERIAAVPDGIYYAEGYLDNNGHENEPLIARLKLTIEEDRVIADFSGSSPQTAGPTNVGPAMAFNALALTVKSFLDPHSPVNHGSFEPLQIINPPGSFLNATLPAPCGGMVECRAVMVSVLVSALGQAMPQRRAGDLKGGANHVYISGRTDAGDMFLLYEYPAGGTGATANTDGNHGTRAWPDGDFNAVWGAEVLEAQAPVQVAAYGIREGSGGVGEHRGGCGIRRDLKVLAGGASLSVLSDKNIIPPYGVAGGGSGACNRFVVLRGTEVIEPSSIPGKVGGFILQAGDIVRIESAGGGGWGDPLGRDAALVAADVHRGYLSPQQARARYGVELAADGTPDRDATRETRAGLRDGRTRLAVAPGTDTFEGPRRTINLPADVRRRLRIAPGDLVELNTAAAGSALRAWVGTQDTQEHKLALGPIATAILGLRDGDSVEVRAAAQEVDR